VAARIATASANIPTSNRREERLEKYTMTAATTAVMASEGDSAICTTHVAGSADGNQTLADSNTSPFVDIRVI